ncbi:MAG: DNA translocase FtsK [Atopobiaceae bacterium]|nr:DNA translocase FtsK [Atopobiaceae bacterium]
MSIEMSRRLIDTLKLFNIDAELDDTVQGPVVTKYKISLAPGTRYSAVTSLADNIKGALHAKSLRIEAPIPGEECIGIEVPNRAPAGISFREIFESDAWKNADAELPLLFGKRADGKELVADLASMPHMLVAGATGQGKSVCLNSLICGLLMTRTPEQLKLIMVDPKSVEFTAYASIPHLIVPVITENKKVVFSLRWAVSEMEKRLKLFARARVRNIYDFNHRQSLSQMEMFGDDTAIGADMPKTVPYIVIIIDEVADLMASSGKEVTPDIARLTAKARAAGIHLILATQRPDAKIITGTIKANIPGRIAFKTATSIDSRTILDDTGAENLIGRGDMLFKSKDGLLIRAQGAWISDQEIASVTRYIEEHSSTEFDDRFTNKLSTIKEEEIDIFADETGGSDTGKDAAAAAKEQVKAEENASDFKKAVECIINTNRASTSHFQRKLGWGYNHSAKIMDMLEDAGIIAPQSGAGPRQIIMDQDQLLAVFNGGRDEAFAAPGGEDGDGGGAEQDFNEEEQQ